MSFLLLIPFWVMRWSHDVLSYSDAFLKGDRASANYNLVMVLVLFAGLTAFMTYAGWAYWKTNCHGWFWCKLLVAIFYLVVAFISFHSLDRGLPATIREP